MNSKLASLSEIVEMAPQPRILREIDRERTYIWTSTSWNGSSELESYVKLRHSPALNFFREFASHERALLTSFWEDSSRQIDLNGLTGGHSWRNFSWKRWLNKSANTRSRIWREFRQILAFFDLTISQPLSLGNFLPWTDPIFRRRLTFSVQFAHWPCKTDSNLFWRFGQSVSIWFKCVGMHLFETWMGFSWARLLFWYLISVLGSK